MGMASPDGGMSGCAGGAVSSIWGTFTLESVWD